MARHTADSSNFTVGGLLSAALELADDGFRVFPITPGKKAPPLVDDWPHLATTDRRQILAWWTKWPRANIGIRTGDGLVVLDIDGAAGEASWRALLAGRPEPVTQEVKTPHGRHLYFSTTEAFRNSAGKLAPGLDVRTDGGYVVGPGSVVTDESYQLVGGHE